MTSELVAQEQPPKWLETGVDFQIYPAGTIFMAKVQRILCSHGTLDLRVGYNLAQRKDFGEHDDEQGGGPGISAGYRYYIQNKEYHGIFLEGRLDLWFMTIDWEDRSGNQVLRSGETSTVVLQPTIVGGYQYVFKNSPWAAELGLAFGFEWNAATNGEEVGQGGISLINVGVTYRFQ